MASLFLASSSPRRVEILTRLGVIFESGGVDIDETPLPGEQAAEMVLRLAEAKANAAQCDGPVLGSDTAVTLDAEIFGKPASEQHALDMLARLSGRTHEVLTAVALKTGGQVLREISRTEVTFREISSAEAREYWRSGEPQGKAGAYAIQGLGGVFVSSIRGSYSGVVGLPVFETIELLKQAGINVWQPVKARIP